MLTDFENSFTIGNINPQNKYNIPRHLLKTSLYYPVKHRSLKKWICCTNYWWKSYVCQIFM